MVFDTDSYLNGILNDPASYGIKNTTGYCQCYESADIDPNYAGYGCLPIKGYFWYNTGHITFRVHVLLSEAVGKFLVGERCGRGACASKLRCKILKTRTDKANPSFAYTSEQGLGVRMISPFYAMEIFSL